MARVKRKVKRRSSSNSVLYFKFRIVPLVRMPRSVAFEKISRFFQSGDMDDDIELEAADFSRGWSGRVKRGSHLDLESVDGIALVSLYNAFRKAQSVRFERVR